MEHIVTVLKKQGVDNTGIFLDVLEKTKVIDKPTKKKLMTMHSDEGQIDEDSFKDIIKTVSVKKHTGVRNVLNNLTQIMTTKSFAALVETLHTNQSLMEEKRALDNRSSADTLEQSAGEDDGTNEEEDESSQYDDEPTEDGSKGGENEEESASD